MQYPSMRFKTPKSHVDIASSLKRVGISDHFEFPFMLQRLSPLSIPFHLTNLIGVEDSFGSSCSMLCDPQLFVWVPSWHPNRTELWKISRDFLKNEKHHAENRNISNDGDPQEISIKYMKSKLRKSENHS
jgi:hypothetical protein